MNARKTDPITSRLAASRAGYFSGAHKQRIINAIRSYGPMSPRALERYTGLTVVQIDRRRIELIRAGVLKVVTHQGRSVRVGGCEVLQLN